MPFSRSEAASRSVLDRVNGINAIGWTTRFSANVGGRTEKIGIGRTVRVDLLGLQSPGGLGAADLFHVRNARAALAGAAGLDEVRDGDRGQQSNDGHYDHDFYQREAGLAGAAHFHSIYLSLLRR